MYSTFCMKLAPKEGMKGMKKMKTKGKRLFSLVLALALLLTSVSVPSVTAEAAKTVKVKKIQITKPKKKSVTLKKGKSLQLKVKVTPKNAKNKKVRYKTSNRKIVRVSSKGKIKAIKNGNAKITITARDGSRKKAVLKVKVVTPVSKVKLNASAKTLTVGQTAALKATVSPATASKKTVKWTTSDKNVATVTSKGVVKGLKAGTAVITATAADGSKKKASCKVTVQAASQTPETPDNPNPPKPPVTTVTLKEIAITKQPYQTGYWIGEKFDPSGMEVTASYSDGKEKVLDAAAYTITPNAETPLTLQDKEIIVSYQEGGVTKTAAVEITVTEEPAVSLRSIEITRQPDKTEYREGERFDPAGMEVTAVYSDGSRKAVEEEACSYEPDRALALDDTEVTVTYQELGRPQTAVVSITVMERPKVALKSIEITTQPNKTEYWEGERFESEGMRVTAVYADGTEMAVGGDVCIIEPDRPLTVSDREMTVTYKDGDVSLSKKISITVRKLTLKKIEVTAMPSKTTYNEGDIFDKTGMEVTATYMNGSTEVITNYTCSEGPLDPADQVVEISYTKHGVTKKTAIDIVVVAKIKLDHITCELKNTEPEIEGTVFREQDIEVTAHFEDGTSGQVSISKCEVSPSAFTLETTSATVYYTYGTRRKSCKVSGFTVKPYRERYTFEDADTVGTIVKHNGEGENLPVEADMADVNLDFTEGLSGNALKMDGTYGIRLDKIAGTESQSYSISMWVKPDNTFKENVALIISTANEFGLGTNTQNWCSLAGTNAQGGLKFWSNGTSGMNFHMAAEGSIPVGESAEWSHIALVVDGTTTAEGTAPAEGSKKALGTLYINGRKVGSGNVQNEKGPNMKTYLGVTGWEWDGYFSGLVDELVFTNEVFTPEDVEGYYLEQYAEKLSKITEVTAAETDIEVAYGTSVADVKRVLAEKVTLSGTNGSQQFSFENTADIWTLEDYTVTTQGEVTAVAKVEAPVGYAFSLENDKVSIWKKVPVTFMVKSPEMITQVTPSENQIEVLYGTTEAQIKEQLAALTFAVTTEHGMNYSIKNAGSLWSLAETQTGYTATASLPRAEVGYEYAEGKSKVTVQITVKQPVVITGLTIQQTKISVPYNSTLSYVQGELAKLKITAAVSNGDAPVLTNKADLWNIAEYHPDTAGEYTATAKITAPLGYKFAEGTENIDTISVTVEVAEKSDQKTLVSIGISQQPNITKYIQGHTFDKTGMVVEAIYANGDREVVTDKVVVLDETKPLELTDTFVKISYTEEDETEASAPITVTQDCSISVVELKDGAAVYYSFDETLSDKQTEGRTAKLVDNGSLAANAALEPVYADGVKGQGILLNSTDKKTALELNANVPSGKKDFTINMWVQPKSLDPQWAMILSAGNAQWSKEFVLYANPNTAAVNSMNVQNGVDPDVNFNDLLFADQWIMLTCVNSEDQMELYANGKKIGDAASVKNGITRLFLGGGWWDPFHGVFDEFSMYDCTLTEEEVAELYHHVPWNIEKIEYEKNLTVTKKNSNEAAVKAELARLPLHAVMRNGEVPSLTSDENWTLSGTSTEGYTATKELQLPEGYAMPDGAKKVVLTVKVTIRNGELTGLRVTPPTKVKYLEGEILDKTGMKVEAVYTEEGAEDTYKDVTELIILSENGTPLNMDEPLKKGEHTITVTYTEGSDKQEETITITVQTIEEALNEARLAQYSFEDNLDNGAANGGSAQMVGSETTQSPCNLIANNAEQKYTEGIAGKGILLNSTSTKAAVELENKIPADATDFTINLWVQPKEQAAWRMILFSGDKSPNIGFGIYGSRGDAALGSISAVNGTNAENANFNDQVVVDRWMMLTWVNSEDKMELYVNGKKLGDGPKLKNAMTRLFLGGDWWNGDFLHAVFDEVSIYNRSLEGKEVKYLYDLVPSIISEVSASEEELMFLLDEVNGNAAKIKEALSKLDINVVMKHGEKCEFENDANWTVPEIASEGTYTATKTLTLPEGYVMNGNDEAKTVQISVEIQVKDETLNESLEITKKPDRLVYVEGETFDPAGMVVTAKYSKGSQRDVTEQVIIEEKVLSKGDKTVGISYTEGGKNASAEVEITVYAENQPESIYAARTAYYSFDGNLENGAENAAAAKMVTANSTMSDSSAAPVFGEGVSNQGLLLNGSGAAAAVELENKIPEGSTDFAINFWVQPKALADYKVLLLGGDIAWNRGLTLYGQIPDKAGQNPVNLIINDAQNPQAITIENQLFVGQWTMFTWVNSKQGTELYANGAKVGSGPAVTKSIKRLFLGGSWWGDGFHGIFDEASIFNRTLTAEEVEYLYSTVPWTIESISPSESSLTFGNTATEADVKKKLSELKIDVSMKNGKIPEFQNDTNWTLTPAFNGAGTYRATKVLTLTGAHVMSNQAKTCTLSVDIEVKSASLTNIEIEKTPGKTAFLVGEVFSKSIFTNSGIKVKANYSDGTSTDITNDVTVNKEGEALAKTDAKITVSYSEGSTHTADIPIKVYEETEVGAMYAARTGYYTFDGENPLENAITRNNAVEEALGKHSGNNVTYPSEGSIKGKALNLGDSWSKGVRLENGAITTSSYTISMWVKADQLPTGQYPCVLYSPASTAGNNMRWYGPCGTPDNFTITTEGSGGKKELANLKNVVASSWQMLTLVVKNGNASFYVNGVKAANGDAELLNIYEGGTDSQIYLGIGVWDSAADPSFVGSFDEVSLFNKALEEEQVKALYAEMSLSGAAE